MGAGPMLALGSLELAGAENGLSHGKKEKRESPIRVGGSKMKSFKIGKKSFLRVDRATPCPICNKPDWCFLASDFKKAYCCRHLDENKPSFAGATEYEIDATNVKDVQIVEIPQMEPAKANILHRVYSLVLEVFGLSDKHLAHLMLERGFNLDQTYLRGYASFTKETMKEQIKFKEKVNGKYIGKTLWEDLFEQRGLPRDAWKGVPGFWYDTNNQTPIFEPTHYGIFIPNRNEFGQIIGGQIRVDKDSMRYSAIVNSTWKDKAKVIVKCTAEEKYHYTVYTFPDYEVYSEGETEKKQLAFPNGLSFKIKPTAKYVWLSTSSKEYGCGAKNAPHYAFPDNVLAQAKFDENGNGLVNLITMCDNVIVTEGLLKSDIIATQVPGSRLEKLGSTLVLAMAGVNSWKQVAYNLKSKTTFSRVYLALDSDFKDNDAVFTYLKQIIQYIQQQDKNKETYVFTWEVGKGLDDFLLSKEALTHKVQAHKF